MRKRYSVEYKRKIIIDYIKNNPDATHRKIRKETKLHPERVFESLEEAFKLAGINPPRTFKFKTKEENRKIIIQYIKKHPFVGGQTISKETKINPSNVFKNIEEAFRSADVEYPRNTDNRTKKEKIDEIIRIVRENPLASIVEITQKSKTQPYHFFINIEDIHKKAGIKQIKKGERERLKKQREIIEYLQKNSLATQREINKACKTHVQNVFKKGIFEAYEKAGIKFPFERLKLYGIGIKDIRDRSKNFEDKIAIKLSGFGKVNKLVKTKRGFADIILERKDKKIVVEVKDYQNKDISISQIRQLNKYLEDCEINLGFLICRVKPKKDSFLIGKNRIFVIEEFELCKIPELIERICSSPFRIPGSSPGEKG